MAKKSKESLEEILEKTLLHKHANEFLDKPNLINYIINDLSAVEFQSHLNAMLPGIHSYRKKMVMTQFIHHRKVFYYELDALNNWKKEKAPKAKTYGVNPKRWQEHIDSKKYFLSGIVVGGLVYLGCLVGALDTSVVPLLSGMLIGVSGMWWIANPQKQLHYLEKQEVKDYANALAKYYAPGQKCLSDLKEKKQNPKAHFTSLYLHALNNMLGFAVGDGEEYLREQLYKERQNVKKLCDNYEKLVKQIHRKKEKPVPVQTWGVCNHISNHIYEHYKELNKKMLEYLNDVFKQFRELNPGFDIGSDYNNPFQEPKGYDGWLDSEDFKID